ncbi:MAG: prepilin-type N-terminal cleavage/methylation domain-containing protein [bacterium]
MSREERNSGFTLVELLLAATLGAMVITAAFTSISVVLKGYRQYKDRLDTYEPARTALARMSQELTAAFLSPHTGRTRFVGIQQEIDGIPMDQLTFVAVINDPQYAGEGESDLSEVQYYIDVDNETPERWLQVRYDPTPDDDPFSGGSSHLLGPHVVAMSLLYFDGEYWLGEWDSKEELPMAINITLGVLEDGKAEQPEQLTQFSTTVYPAVYRTQSGETETLR